jgi:hypothetical protein
VCPLETRRGSIKTYCGRRMQDTRQLSPVVPL